MMPEVVDRRECPGTRHGTCSAYRSGCRCPEAREAHRLYQKRHREGRSQRGYLDPTGARRRIQALMAIGWPTRLISQRLGWGDKSRNVFRFMHDQRVYQRTDAAVRRVFEELSGTAGPSEITRRRSIRAGYLPPLAWDDIDNDPEPACKAATSGNTHRRETDWAMVHRLVSGHGNRDAATDEDYRQAVDQLVRTGTPVADMPGILGISRKRVDTYRNTLQSRRWRAQRQGTVS